MLAPTVNRTYRMRTGLAAGMRKKGGLGLRQSLGVATSQIPEEDGFLRRLDLGGKVVYDVGGFEGVHTLFFADRVGSLGQVVTFEPHPANYEKVLDNVRANGLTNVTVLRMAVGREAGRLVLTHLPGDTGRATADGAIRDAMRDAREGTTSLSVPVTSVDHEIAARGLPDPDFVKVDVEGLEVDVLAGMARTIERVAPDLFVELHGIGLDAKRANAARVVRVLFDAGYAVRHVESDTPLEPAADPPPEGHLYATAR